MVSFGALQLSEPLLVTLAALGHDAPTAVQAEVIPAVLAERDVWAVASTGSGKTAAFVLPLLERFARGAGRRAETPHVSVLVLAPTRELAVQIGEAFRAYGARLAIAPKCVVAVGGVSINPQMMALRGGADVVVATPGRLLDLMDKNALSLRGLGTLVLDEADRLLDEGFSPQLASVSAAIGPHPQTLLFSATFGPRVSEVAAAVLRDAVRIDVTGSVTDLPAIAHRAIRVDVPRRTQLLAHLIKESAWSHVLVFVASAYSTEHVAQKLRGLRIHAAALSGDLSQGARTQVLERFKKGQLRVLVATDLAARGLDINGLPAVIQYDLPRATVDYVHRSGRTGRAGEPGVAIAFVTADAQAHFELIRRRHGIVAELEEVPGFVPLERPTPPVPGASTGGVKGRRKSKKDKIREALARAARSEG